jgi:hypothetical protein
MIGLHFSFSNLYRSQLNACPPFFWRACPPVLWWTFFVNGACGDQFLARLKAKMGAGFDLGGRREPPKETALLKMP